MLNMPSMEALELSIQEAAMQQPSRQIATHFACKALAVLKAAARQRSGLSHVTATEGLTNIAQVEISHMVRIDS